MKEEDFQALEGAACTPKQPDPNGFNKHCQLPHGLTVGAVGLAMVDFCNFLGFINRELHTREMPRLEAFMMQANFSSLVGEFQTSTIPKHCTTLVKNRYHNGHPDMVPKGYFPNDSVQHADVGIEVKGSRYRKAWQGHNAEDCFLIVFVFTSSRPTDSGKGISPAPFGFVEVLGAKLEKTDWQFAGRKEGSRRTITASVKASGFGKMQANWIYRDPLLAKITPVEAADSDEAQSTLELL